MCFVWVCVCALHMYGILNLFHTMLCCMVVVAVVDATL